MTRIQPPQGRGADSGGARGQLQPLLLCLHPGTRSLGLEAGFSPHRPRRAPGARLTGMATGLAFLRSGDECVRRRLWFRRTKRPLPAPPPSTCCSASGHLDPPEGGAPAGSSSAPPGHLGCGRHCSRLVRGRQGCVLQAPGPEALRGRPSAAAHRAWDGGCPHAGAGHPFAGRAERGGGGPRPRPDLEAARGGFARGGGVRVLSDPEGRAAGPRLPWTLPGPPGTGRWGWTLS